MNGTGSRGTAAEYSRHRGVSKESVSKALRDGRIKAKDGLIDFAAADRSWARMTDTRKPRNSVNGTPKASPKKRDSATASLADHHARRAAAQAEREELDLAEKKGSMVDLELTERRWESKSGDARRKLEAGPDRLSGILAAETDPAEVHRILREWIRDVCLELSAPNR